MTPSANLQRIVVVPRNGYVNRLQAWASAAILGAELDLPVQVMWEPEPAAGASAETLFAERARMSFIGRGALDELLGAAHEALPRYLATAPSGAALVLAGHDRGEQAFMSEVAERIAHPDCPAHLVIIAGGKFHLPGARGFGAQRQRFYTSLAWSEEITDRVEAALLDRSDFVALHIRGTDHSRAAPTNRQITDALRGLRASQDLTSLFIAADTDATRGRWRHVARTLGFDPWSSDAQTYDRGHGVAGVDAMVDWVLLGRSSALIHSAISTFGEEAAIASGNANRAIPLRASAARERVRGITAGLRSAATYPSRHWVAPR